MVELRGAWLVGCVLGFAGVASGGDFADFVVSYVPAPGQFINGEVSDGSSFNDPSAALGPPTGGGLVSPDNSGVVTLGGFGGEIVLGFDETVEDDPLNPMGIDAIVYGNAFWVGSSGEVRWAEAGVIEISLDVNRNGLADDAWYVIPGSDIDGENPLGVFEVMVWDDDPGTAVPPLDVSLYPDPLLYPGIGSSYETGGFRLPLVFDGLTLSNAASDEPGVVERYWGYADVSPTLELGDVDADGVVEDAGVDPGVFYTRPDNRYEVGVSGGSGGGDGFDIGEAVDPATGERAGLRGFDFVRIRTASGVAVGVFGEKSVEVDAVADVRPVEPSDFDVDGDGALTVEDLYAFYGLRDAQDLAADLNGDRVVDLVDRDLLEGAVRRGEAADIAGGFGR